MTAARRLFLGGVAYDGRVEPAAEGAYDDVVDDDGAAVESSIGSRRGCDIRFRIDRNCEAAFFLRGMPASSEGVGGVIDSELIIVRLLSCPRSGIGSFILSLHPQNMGK